MDASHYASAANSASNDTIYRATPQDLYNDLGKSYEDAYNDNKGQMRSLQWLISHLPPGAKVLDMGCGTGVPASKTLSSAGLSVTGIDISPVMLSHARQSVPDATFFEADLFTFDPKTIAGSNKDDDSSSKENDNDIDAIVAYFSLIGHVSQDQIRAFFRRVSNFLNPGGLFVYATVPLAGDQVATKWMGKEFPSSSFSPEDTLAEVKAAGFEVLEWDETKFLPKGKQWGIGWGEEVFEEPHLFVYARKT